MEMRKYCANIQNTFHIYYANKKKIDGAATAITVFVIVFNLYLKKYNPVNFDFHNQEFHTLEIV